VRVIAYDPERVTPDEVAHYSDLADPRFKGEVCMRSSTNIYNLSLMGELIGRMGHDAAQAGPMALSRISPVRRRAGTLPRSNPSQLANAQSP
jgi:ABC-type Fe3+ transport system substrate-binding protein